MYSRKSLLTHRYPRISQNLTIRLQVTAAADYFIDRFQEINRHYVTLIWPIDIVVSLCAWLDAPQSPRGPYILSKLDAFDDNLLLIPF